MTPFSEDPGAMAASGTSPTPHDHRQPVPGCFRCELNEDEMTTNDGTSTALGEIDV